MKRLLIILSALLIAGGTAYAQDTMADAVNDWANGWKYAFSKDGKKNWESEYTLRWRSGFFTDGAKFTGGIRVDEKRTLGVFAGAAKTWDDATPATIKSISLGLTFRRYWHFGQKKIFALYSDIYAGAGYVYSVSNPESYMEEGSVLFVGGLEPGIRVRCYKNLHIFLGPTIATDSIGLHLGVGF